MKQLIRMRLRMVFFVIAASYGLAGFSQVVKENFNSFDPIIIENVDNGKAFIEYQHIASIEKNTGKWVIPVYYGNIPFGQYPGSLNADNYLTRSTGNHRGRGLVYAFNNSKGKVKTLEGMGFDYLNRKIDGVEDNFSFAIWGIKDPEEDGWENKYTIGFGGFGKFADDNVLIWTDEEDLHFTRVVYRKNIAFSNEWETYSFDKDIDVSGYDWIFICFGHTFQKEQKDAFNALFGIDNVVLPGFDK